jgi:hypothetical protein
MRASVTTKQIVPELNTHTIAMKIFRDMIVDFSAICVGCKFAERAVIAGVGSGRAVVIRHISRRSAIFQARRATYSNRNEPLSAAGVFPFKAQPAF